ncbi:MAG: dockerin type I repeat-containing protein [Chitinispirillales bacterium]|jgi:hypothetical protein|nr:dockerin type I repeat-containing protein [Chitinispirillales bacterium]
MKNKIVKISVCFTAVFFTIAIVAASMVNAVEIEEVLPEEEATMRYYGDADLDGQITMMDVITVQKALAGVITLSFAALKNSDVNGDKAIDDDDVKLIQRYLAGCNDSTLIGKMWIEL